VGNPFIIIGRSFWLGRHSQEPFGTQGFPFKISRVFSWLQKRGEVNRAYFFNGETVGHLIPEV